MRMNASNRQRAFATERIVQKKKKCSFGGFEITVLEFVCKIKKKKRIKAILTMRKSILNPTAINGLYSDDFRSSNSLYRLKRHEIESVFHQKCE